MKAASIVILAAIAGIIPAIAEPAPPPKQTIAQCLGMLVALRNLDGHATPTGNALIPWEFGSGTLRLRIANNITALALFETSLETVRNGIVKELLAKLPADKDGRPPTAIPPGTPEFDQLQKQYGDAIAQPCDVKLAHIKASDLKLDKNEIPVSVLAALSSIIDDDMGGK